MKKSIRQLNILLASAVLCFSFSVPVFAEETVKYSNELTSSPIRIFFAILSSTFDKVKTICKETGGMVVKTIRGERV